MKNSVSVCLLLAAFAMVVFGESKSAYVIVLGVAQDGGVPQTGDKNHPGWENPDLRRLVACLGVVNPAGPSRWMFDATPDFPEQLHRLDVAAPVEAKPGLDGIFLTHAHMGHYTGLMHLGYEGLGASRIPVFAMPRMHEYLRTNGPWEQLVRYENIVLRQLGDREPVRLSSRISVTPLLVPHRQEYSEVVGFRIQGPERSVLFIPDIDRWEDWDAKGTKIEDEIAKVNVAYLDASFYANGEIPGRDMSGFPHPFITHSMERFRTLPVEQRAKVRFIHLNHTNPALDPNGEARATIERNGFRVAEANERVELSGKEE